ncbi:uncharacterized protein LOC114716908 [Neltuma alba]|uniref:uncharacterized protein LOC114716908 n=1 Tax=Neltuma alba TaxID=207710 RepID=UPI0010A4ACF3|nr:uncharacterized protein LOC114716908 [Prosopis alba]
MKGHGPQHCILVQRWMPYFDPFKNQLGRIVTWVRLPDIPMHCYNSHCITKVGERIGRPFQVDLNTLLDRMDSNAKVERGRYARLCVELDLQKQLVPRLIVANEAFNMGHEGLNLICFECGIYGHRREVCPWKKATQQNSASTSTAAPTHHPPEMQPETRTVNSRLTGNDTFSLWMFTTGSSKSRFSRNKFQQEVQSEPKQGAKGVRRADTPLAKSRFAALVALDNERTDDRELRNSIEVVSSQTKKEQMLVNSGKKKQVTASYTKMAAGTKNGGSSKILSKPKFQQKAQGKIPEKPKVNSTIKVAEQVISHEAKTRQEWALVGQNTKDRSKNPRQRTHVVVSGQMECRSKPTSATTLGNPTETTKNKQRPTMQ